MGKDKLIKGLPNWVALGLAKKINRWEIVDSLNCNCSGKPLSAAAGYDLQQQIEALRQHGWNDKVGATTFLELKDTFDSYEGLEGFAIVVNPEGTGLIAISTDGFKGDKGEPGAPLQIKGVKDSVDDLPVLGNIGDIWNVNGSLYSWNGVEWIYVGDLLPGSGGGVSTLLELTDVDAGSYVGKAKQVLAVKEDESGTEFVEADLAVPEFTTEAETINYRFPAAVETTQTPGVVHNKFLIPQGFPGADGRDVEGLEFGASNGLDANNEVNGPNAYYVEGTLTNGPSWLSPPYWLTVDNNEEQTAVLQNVVSATGQATRTGTAASSGGWASGYQDAYLTVQAPGSNIVDAGYFRFSYNNELPGTDGLNLIWKTFSVFYKGELDTLVKSIESDGPTISSTFTLQFVNETLTEGTVISVGDTAVGTKTATGMDIFIGDIQRPRYHVNVASGTWDESSQTLTLVFAGTYQNELLIPGTWNDWQGEIPAAAEPGISLPAGAAPGQVLYVDASGEAVLTTADFRGIPIAMGYVSVADPENPTFRGYGVTAVNMTSGPGNYILQGIEPMSSANNNTTIAFAQAIGGNTDNRTIQVRLGTNSDGSGNIWAVWTVQCRTAGTDAAFDFSFVAYNPDKALT